VPEDPQPEFYGPGTFELEVHANEQHLAVLFRKYECTEINEEILPYVTLDRAQVAKLAEKLFEWVERI
jgi:hypothetical protein